MAHARSATETAAMRAAAVVPERALVKFSRSLPRAARDAVLGAVGARRLRSIPGIGYEVVTASASALEALTRARGVEVAEPDYAGRVALPPSDACLTSCTGIPNQWHLARTNAALGWDAFAAAPGGAAPSGTAAAPGGTAAAPGGAAAAPGTAAAPVTIAVLDTHVDATNPDWVGAAASSPDSRDGGQLDLTNARDWLPSSRWTGAAAYHGTFVAGLASAAAGNDRDAAGVAHAARVLPLTVVDGGGNTDAASLADAIVYAQQRGARVINLSLGILGDSQAVHDAVKRASATALVVAAAGNNTGAAAFYPGSYPEVMSAGGTDAEDGHAPCANYNSNISVSAPADRLWGLFPMPSERGQAPCGTSAAAPQVSGLAALLFMQDPSRAPADVRRIIERTADDLGAPGRDNDFGFGRINVERALRDGATAQVTLARAQAAGPNTTTTVTALATSARPISRAELIVGRPDATPVAMQPADGAFGGTSERLVATIPAGTAGPHEVWVRAFDGAWSAAAATVLAVDGRAPTISSAQASNGVRATQPVTVTFAANDDHATTISYGIQVRSQATNQVLYTYSRVNVAAGAQSIVWTPPLTAPAGPFAVKIAVADPYNNVSQLEVGAILT
jgi:hypothetical protein